MSLTQFFLKTLGAWKSTRMYLYPKKKGSPVEVSETYFIWTQDNADTFSVEWSNLKMASEGKMSITLEDPYKLKRNVGYFTNDQTVSEVILSSPNHLKTVTEYNNMNFTETITFLDDNTRQRHTIAKRILKDGKLGDIFLVGSYLETRCLEEDGEDADVSL